MNVIEREIFRAKRKNFISVALSGTTGVLLLIVGAGQSLGYSVNFHSIVQMYVPSLLTLTAIWTLALRGYRGATLSDSEKALAIRRKKKPSQESP